MDEEISIIVEQLKAAGSDVSKQVPVLVRLGEFYLEKAKTTPNGADFTKASALYNAALVRSRLIGNHETDEDEILQRIVETYREFLQAFAHDDGVSVDEIRSEIDSHKEFLRNERRIFKERLNEIDSRFIRTDKTEDQYEVFKICLLKWIWHMNSLLSYLTL